jgi:Papain family cysteine protease
MAKVSVSDVQAQIASHGATWEAGPTTVSELPEDVQNRRLGLKLDEGELQRIQNAMRAPAFARPVAFAPERDWRNRDGKNWLTSIKDQGNCGSCVSFATVATLETQARIHYNQHDWNVDLSEAELFFCGAGRMCDQGWWPSRALEYAQTRGVPDDACFRYQDHDMDCQTCADRAQRMIEVTEWEEVAPVDERKDLLDKVGPLVACMAVYGDFFTYRSGVYRHVTGELAGYHAVCCVGYSEREKCWICKNSWGEGWGDHGYFKIAYGEAEIDTRFAMYAIKGIGGTLKPSEQPTEEVTEAVAEAVFADYHFANGTSVLWAYADQKWRSREASEAQLANLALLAFQAGSLMVYYKGDKIERLVAMKRLASS